MDSLIVGRLTEKFIRDNLKKDEGILSDLRMFAIKNKVPIINHEVKKMLEVILTISPPKRVLEIGTAIGYSSIFFAQMMTSEGQIDTIEVDPDMVLFSRESILRAGFETRINVICGDALEVLPCLDSKYDLIFLDGPKAKYIEMLPDCLRLLNTGGLLVTDNILYRGLVAESDSRIPQKRRSLVRNLRDYIEFLCNSNVLETSVIPIGDGVSLSIKK